MPYVTKCPASTKARAAASVERAVVRARTGVGIFFRTRGIGSFCAVLCQLPLRAVCPTRFHVRRHVVHGAAGLCARAAHEHDLTRCHRTQPGESRSLFGARRHRLQRNDADASLFAPPAVRCTIHRIGLMPMLIVVNCVICFTVHKASAPSVHSYASASALCLQWPWLGRTAC